MKKYEKPQIEEVTIETEDIITISNGTDIDGGSTNFLEDWLNL